MSSSKVIVLKFGSSVLRSAEDMPSAVHEIYRWVRQGWRVVAVVSAFEGETDALLAQARRWDRTPHQSATALLASTGELRSAALLTLALDRAGIDAQVLDVAAIGLRTRGVQPLDAQPVRVNTAKLRRLLARFPVLVLPGFLGRDAAGGATLLGRGGSDCSALFLAHQLGARCRLIKDVDGLYEWDPRQAGQAPRRFQQLPWHDALQLDGGIVQHKAVAFAKQNRQSFEVGALHRSDATRIADLAVAFCQRSRCRRPLRVLLLGLGTVGLGVYESLTRLPEMFQVAGVCVRDKSRAGDVPPVILFDDLREALRIPCDVVVELIGDSEPAHSSIRWALRRGINVVTANKRVLAQFGPELERLACSNGASLRWSAAVGGAVPLLEQLEQFLESDPPVSVLAVLNGTTNFVLDRWQAGESLESALQEAREAGFAEADASRDLSGLDAADKLVLLHRQLTGEWLPTDAVTRQTLDESRLSRWESGQRPAIRQVASWTRTGATVRLAVSLRFLSPRHPLARLKLAENGAIISTGRNQRTLIRGKGAGRWPTSEAVLADLFELAEQNSRSATASLVSNQLLALEELTS